MASQIRPTWHVSVEEYLDLEERSLLRHEYVAGRVYEMTGGTARHNEIAGNILVASRAAARRGGCRVYINDVKVRAAVDAFYYPDVVIVCRPVPRETLVIDDPCVLVEVTSPSTERIDWTEKRAAYARIPSLRAWSWSSARVSWSITGATRAERGSRRS